MKFGTIVVNRIDNPFNPHSSKVTKTDIHGGTLVSYIDGYLLGAEVLVLVNGKLIPEDNFNTYIVKPNDNITYTYVISGGGGGGKQIASMVAMIALSIVAPMTASFIMGNGFTFGGLAALEGMAFAGGLAITAGIMVAGSLLINAVLGASPSSITSSNPELESTTYSWDGIQTSRDLNKPIPVLYGTHALGGTVINSRFYYNGSDDWIGTQIALCQGEIEPIQSSDIKINDNYYSNLITDSTLGNYQYRTGTFDQSIMTGYSDSSHNNGNASGVLVYNTWKTVESVSTNIDFFRLHIEFPSGLYKLNTSTGAKETKSVTLKAQYRVKGTSTWYDIYNYDSNGTLEWLYTYKELVSYSDYEGSYTSWENREFWSSSENAPIPTSTNEISGFTRTSTFRYNKQLPYAPSTILTFQSASSVPLKKYFEPVSYFTGEPLHLTPAQYEFRVMRLTPDDAVGDNYNVSTVHLRFIEEVNTTDINYGGVALLGIDLKATNQLSNSRPNFITLCTRKPLLLNNVYRDSTNPAWICLDILTNTQYGMGIALSDIDITEINRWAEFCDGGATTYFNINKSLANVNNTYVKNNLVLISKDNLNNKIVDNLLTLNRNTSSLSAIGAYIIGNVEYTFEMSIDNLVSAYNTYIHNDIDTPDGEYLVLVFNNNIKLGTSIGLNLYFKDSTVVYRPKLAFNGVFDTASDIWTSLQDVAQVGRGQIVLRGNKYSCIFDSIKTIKGLFNAANSKNVTVQYLSTADIATEIEIQYSDKAINYEMNSISVQDINAMASGIRSNKTTKQIKGIVSEQEALVAGKYLLASSKMLRRVITLDADIESITQTVGDLIAVQTDVTQYGIGGLVEKVLGSLVYLDNTVQLEKGKTYSIKFKNKLTDSIQEFTFVAADASFDFTFDELQYNYIGELTFDDFSLGISFENNSIIETNLIALNGIYDITVDDRYTFGLAGSDSILCTIRDISREGDLNRKITAIEYNESILDFNYDNDMIQRITANGKVKNEITNFKANDRLLKLDNGQVVASISFGWDSKVNSSYNIYLLEEGGFKHYLGNNIEGTRFEYANTVMTPEKQYTIYIEDMKDISIKTSLNYIITSFSTPPEDITNIIFTTNDNSIIVNVEYPNKPLDFAYYDVYVDNILDSRQISDKFVINGIKNKQSYSISIKPIDSIGKEGNIFNKTFTVTNLQIGTVSYTQDKEKININVLYTNGSFDFGYIKVISNNVTNTYYSNTFSIPADFLGELEFTYEIFDVLGNTNGVVYSKFIEVLMPVINNLSASIAGKELVLIWDMPSSGVPIDFFEVEYDGAIYKAKSTQYRLPVYWGGIKNFKVRAVSVLDTVSDNATIDVSIYTPTIGTLQAEVIDNNVLLRWEGIAGTLPIDNFMLYKGDDELNLTLIGEKKGTFTTIFENSAGVYTYWMCAIDSAGNYGVKKKISTAVSEPPDYVLNVDWNSTFTGTLTNGVTFNNELVLPVNTTETIEEHFLSRSWTSPNSQTQAGYLLWLEPFYNNAGTYVEVFDYGTILSSSLISCTIGKQILKGTPIFSITLSTSSDGINYTNYVNQTQVYATGFRYVKLSISVSGVDAALSIYNINVRLDSKTKTDTGIGTVSNATNGVDVYFNKPFVDINSIVVTPKGINPIIPIYDFVDAPNPTHFKVYLYDVNGNRITGSFSWSVSGY